MALLAAPRMRPAAGPAPLQGRDRRTPCPPRLAFESLEDERALHAKRCDLSTDMFPPSLSCRGAFSGHGAVQRRAASRRLHGRARRRSFRQFRTREVRKMAQAKVAAVTGAGSGIGGPSALALLREGYAVVLAGRRADACEHDRRGGRAPARARSPCPTDVSDPAAVQRAVRARPRRRSAGSTCCSTTPAPARRRSRWRT